MRFLCLHGHGTNSQILKAQLDPLLARLPSDWEFEFLDGEMNAEPAPGVESIFPGPFLCFHGEPVPDDVQRAVDLVKEVVLEEGPFDGVIGFSQGAAVAATVIAHEAKLNPHQELFKVAIFLSSTGPFDLSAGRLRLAYEGTVDDIKIERYDSLEGGSLVPDDGTDWMTDYRSIGVIQEFQARRTHLSDLGQQSIDVLLRYHSSVHGVLINIPTVHVVGFKDDYADQGRDLAAICDPKISQVVTHDGGHQLPRDLRTVTKTAEAIQWAVDRMLFHN
ncbi:FSH1 domain-containing protein [Trichoderma simmonsii]|uniref:Serine hydrolase domain-containing protein n=2 Tax=Trichoderma TaxID=5543 RepID=A0A9P4X4B6_9HYPO|nr:hypothetical protein CFAM422_012294 [Trichoderma lentiforme]KAK4069324.1 hypothetical protein Trihar35433_5903 [Trichoderma harzianum]QYT04753.1 FSH1 domain-containing protein [Trichoderma simmonsii]